MVNADLGPTVNAATNGWNAVAVKRENVESMSLDLPQLGDPEAFYAYAAALDAAASTLDGIHGHLQTSSSGLRSHGTQINGWTSQVSTTTQSVAQTSEALHRLSTEARALGRKVEDEKVRLNRLALQWEGHVRVGDSDAAHAVRRQFDDVVRSLGL